MVSLILRKVIVQRESWRYSCCWVRNAAALQSTDVRILDNFFNFFAGFINVATWQSTHTHTHRPNETKLNFWFEICTRTLLPKRRCYRNSTTKECSFAPRMDGNGQVHFAPSEWVCHKQMETRSKWTHQNQTQGRSRTEWSRKCKSWLNSASDRWERSKHGQTQNPGEGRKSCTQNW